MNYTQPELPLDRTTEEPPMEAGRPAPDPEPTQPEPTQPDSGDRNGDDDEGSGDEVDDRVLVGTA